MIGGSTNNHLSDSTGDSDLIIAISLNANEVNVFSVLLYKIGAATIAV